MGEFVWAVDATALNFSVKLDLTDCFVCLFQANFFFLKLKSILIEINIQITNKIYSFNDIQAPGLQYLQDSSQNDDNNKNYQNYLYT